MTRAPSFLPPIDPVGSSLASDRTCPAGALVSRLCRSSIFFPADLYAPKIAAEQGGHLSGAAGCRFLSSVTRIAVRGSLTLAWAIASACRPIALPALPDSALMIQPGPRAITTVFSVSRQNLLHPKNSAAVLPFKHCGVRECAKFSKAGVPW